jgi:hypothetical protein
MPKARSVVILEEIMHARLFPKPFRGGISIRKAGMVAQMSALSCKVTPAVVWINAVAISTGVPSFIIFFNIFIPTLSNLQNTFCN